MAESVAATIYSVWRGQFIRNSIDATLEGVPLPGRGHAAQARQPARDDRAERLSKNPSLIFRKIFLWGRLPAGLASQKPTGSWFRYHIDQRLSF